MSENIRLHAIEVSIERGRIRTRRAAETASLSLAALRLGLVRQHFRLDFAERLTDEPFDTGNVVDEDGRRERVTSTVEGEAATRPRCFETHGEIADDRSE